MIQAVLQEAARRPVTDEPVKLLLEKLQDVAYNAEDVLDDFTYEILRLGKTSIARKICELAMEKKHFDVTLWVCASNDFNERWILGEMLQQIDEHTGGLRNLDAILKKLHKELENKTFLLVLDDVWSEDPDTWHDLKDLLLKINKKNGNAVVVTTRSKQVADMMETSPGSQHEPKKLSDDECWSIIKQKFWEEHYTERGDKSGVQF
ncbi:hypothetical protein OIU78_026904 [Salix suchowensis]|nr:hypothetical protein OIU78_026904 [Salix suchowensis]